MPLLSVIIPAYNEQESVAFAVNQISACLQPEEILYEIIFVDDGSKDDTYKQIEALSRQHEMIRGISFSRNFGKEAAIFAGLKQAKGDCCVVMDCDMQHPPSAIPHMYRLWESGYQIVEGVKSDRGQESGVHRTFSNLFYHSISRFSGLEMKHSSDFKFLDREVVDTLLSLPEKHVFFRGLSFWVGYRSTKVEYEVAPRIHGKTKWSFFKLMRYAINNITSFTSYPLQIVTFIGVLLLILSFFLGIQTLIRFFLGRSAGGFPTIIVLLLIIGGCIMVSLGIIGHYIAKIYNEVKNRPLYIVARRTEEKKEVNLTENQE